MKLAAGKRAGTTGASELDIQHGRGVVVGSPTELHDDGDGNGLGSVGSPQDQGWNNKYYEITSTIGKQ